MAAKGNMGDTSLGVLQSAGDECSTEVPCVVQYQEWQCNHIYTLQEYAAWWYEVFYFLVKCTLECNH